MADRAILLLNRPEIMNLLIRHKQLVEDRLLLSQSHKRTDKGVNGKI